MADQQGDYFSFKDVSGSKGVQRTPPLREITREGSSASAGTLEHKLREILAQKEFSFRPSEQSGIKKKIDLNEIAEKANNRNQELKPLVPISRDLQLAQELNKSANSIKAFLDRRGDELFPESPEQSEIRTRIDFSEMPSSERVEAANNYNEKLKALVAGIPKEAGLEASSKDPELEDFRRQCEEFDRTLKDPQAKIKEAGREASSKGEFDFEDFRRQCEEFDNNTQALTGLQRDIKELAQQLTEGKNGIKDFFDKIGGKILSMSEENIDFSAMPLSEMVEKVDNLNEELKKQADVELSVTLPRQDGYEDFRRQCEEFDNNTQTLKEYQVKVEELDQKLTEGAKSIKELRRIDYCNKVLKGKNMDMISSQIFLGSERGAKNPDELRFIDVSLIVDLRMPDLLEPEKGEGQHDEEELKKRNIDLLKVPTPNGTDVKPSVLKTEAEKIADYLKKDEERRVMVHCQHGTGRSPQIVWGTMMKMGGYGLTQAQAMVNLKRQVSLPNAVTMKMFRRLQQEWAIPVTPGGTPGSTPAQTPTPGLLKRKRAASTLSGPSMVPGPDTVPGPSMVPASDTVPAPDTAPAPKRPKPMAVKRATLPQTDAEQRERKGGGEGDK